MRVFATLTSTNYCVSPLDQSGLEIPCEVEIFMLPTVKNNELIDIFQKYVDVLYYEREDLNTVGFFVEEDVSERQSAHKIKKSPIINQRGQKSGSTRSTSKASHKDICSFFVSKPKTPTTKPTSTSSLATNGADYSKKPKFIELNDSEDE